MVPLASRPTDEPARSWFDFYRTVSARLEVLVADSAFGAALTACFLRTEPDRLSEVESPARALPGDNDISATATSTRGFLLAVEPTKQGQFAQAFLAGLRQCAAQRVPRRSPSVHWNAQLLYGIAAGHSIHAGEVAESEWLQKRLEALIGEPPSVDQIIAAVALTHLRGPADLAQRLRTFDPASSEDAAVALWAFLEHRHHFPQQLVRELLTRLPSWQHRLLMAEPGDFTLPAAAAATRVAASALRTMATPQLSGVERISNILSRFPIAIARERRPPQDEYDVQRVLWTMLAGDYPDLQDEAWLAKFGVYHPRADFAVESVRVVIEAKYIRKAGDFRPIQDQIASDATSYTSRPSIIDRVIAVVYDRSSSMYLHGEFRNGLLKTEGIADVIVFPALSTRPSTRNQRGGRPTRVRVASSPGKVGPRKRGRKVR